MAKRVSSKPLQAAASLSSPEVDVIGRRQVIPKSFGRHASTTYVTPFEISSARLTAELLRKETCTSQTSGSGRTLPEAGFRPLP